MPSARRSKSRRWDEPRREDLSLACEALGAARSYGWNVVGFAPPFSPTLVQRLGSESETRGLYRDYQRRVATLFERHGFRFLNLTDVRSIPSSPNDFSPNDGGHPDIPCSQRIRRKLDAAASTPR
ncbi:MAG: hypothetical protein ABI948_01200 [Thermoleophilia bacterium]